MSRHVNGAGRTEGPSSESASLVRHATNPFMSYTESNAAPAEADSAAAGAGAGATTDPSAAPLADAAELDTEDSVLSQFHEDAIQQAGVGLFQFMLFLVLGLSLAADTIELFVVAYVIPSAEVELCMTSIQKGWLGAITFVGMMIGAIIWGVLSDAMGRRRTLVWALTVNVIFGIVTVFMPTYGTFMLSRLCSGVGIGGSIPIVFAYFCEFLTKARRGKYLSWLLVFWSIGGVFVAFAAWVIIPRTGVMVVIEERAHFSSWRVFLLVCNLPSILALLGLTFMPESPRFLLEAGREIEAMRVYQRIYKWNHSDPCAQYALTELELPKQRGYRDAERAPSKTIMAGLVTALDKFWSRLSQLLLPSHRSTTLVLLFVWFMAAFGYYGLSIWFPEFIKMIKSRDYSTKATFVIDAQYEHNYFNYTISNTKYINSTFSRCKWSNAILNHVDFINCDIRESVFTDVKSSRTNFINSTLIANRFVDTDIYEYRFKNCTLLNNSFQAMVPGCKLDFDYNLHYVDVFQENLIGQISLLPGSFIASYLLDKVGRAKMIAVSMLISSGAGFFMWFLQTKIGVIVFEAAFNMVFISGWNALDVLTTEVYPTNLRTTGYGFISSVSRVAGVIGTLTFGQFIEVNLAIPMLTTVAVLAMGGLAALRLPETKDVLV
ncbi:synaptic vesicle glycoprotein 2B-like [Pollicipes pollicipes]|uniref:synaptic vesicle glycoprotein 2B-like n=1 Tax=Pollicipes pollicipes TaxID=41117 RepID=UPI00188588A1|nr:synaptic vesicle glycoprotein 2B-like [Pollicipes pollicipes]